MSAYQLLPPDEPERNQSRRFVLATVMIMLLAGILGGASFWLRGSAFPLDPTPTLTATPGAPRPATPDFRATRFAEDQQTAVAYYAKATLQTPVSFGLPVINGPAQNTPTPLTASPIVAPGGVVGDGAPTATPIGASPLDPTAAAALISLPVVGNETSLLVTPPPLPPPTALPTATSLPVDVPTPTATQPPTPTPTPTTYFVATMRANVRQNANAPLRQAPINSSAALGTLGGNTALTLVGRDERGEWVVDNSNRWLRQAYITVNGNQLSTGAPQGANPNDVRWLPTRAWPTNINLAPPPTPTLIPFDDFPTTRYDSANTARLPGTFRNNMVVDSFSSASAAQGPAVPLIVVGPHVLLATTDGRVFSFDKNSTGNQLQNFSLGPRVKFPLAAQDGTVYLVDEQNRITALDLNTNPARLIWQSPVTLPGGVGINAQTGVTIVGNRLYIAADSGAKRVVLQYNRETGQLLNPKFEADGADFQSFAVGHQLLYVAGSKIWALDLETLEVVWVWERDLPFVLPPVYAKDGIGALAELYVVATTGRIYSLDANTGLEVRNYESNNEPVQGLALGNLQLYAAGNGFIKAYDRRNSNNALWRQPTYGEVLSGPFASAGLVLLITANDQVQFFDPNNNGNRTFGPSAPAGRGGAIAGNFIFIPDGGGRVAKFREQ